MLDLPESISSDGPIDEESNDGGSLEGSPAGTSPVSVLPAYGAPMSTPRRRSCSTSGAYDSGRSAAEAALYCRQQPYPPSRANQVPRLLLERQAAPWSRLGRGSDVAVDDGHGDGTRPADSPPSSQQQQQLTAAAPPKDTPRPTFPPKDAPRPAALHPVSFESLMARFGLAGQHCAAASEKVLPPIEEHGGLRPFPLLLLHLPPAEEHHGGLMSHKSGEDIPPSSIEEQGCLRPCPPLQQFHLHHAGEHHGGGLRPHPPAPHLHHLPPAAEHHQGEVAQSAAGCLPQLRQSWSGGETAAIKAAAPSSRPRGGVAGGSLVPAGGAPGGGSDHQAATGSGGGLSPFKAGSTSTTAAWTFGHRLMSDGQGGLLTTASLKVLQEVKQEGCRARRASSPGLQPGGRYDLAGPQYGPASPRYGLAGPQYGSASILEGSSSSGLLPPPSAEGGHQGGPTRRLSTPGSSSELQAGGGGSHHLGSACSGAQAANGSPRYPASGSSVHFATPAAPFTSSPSLLRFASVGQMPGFQNALALESRQVGVPSGRVWEDNRQKSGGT